MTLDIHTQLAVAIQIAATAHVAQRDKGGKPYILHPLHLMSQLLFDPQLATIAVLHDVIEDDPTINFTDLTHAGMSPRVVHVLKLLTHRPSDSYEDYIEGICLNYEAILVKRKDLEHNTDITRLKGIREKDVARMAKYHKAFVRLTEAKHKHEGA